MIYPDNLNFTSYSEESFYDTVDTESFKDEDAESIYNHLQKKMSIIPFGDYLKRYIFQAAGFEGNWRDISLKDYQSVIIDSFNENNTPGSFYPTSSKLSALSKNWLTQTSVNRQVVFLLGFGLNMSVSDVSQFLVHAQRERDFNFRNPLEIICWYCFKNKFKFPKFEALYEEYEKLPVNAKYINYGATIGIRALFMKVENEEELMMRLSEIKTENEGNIFSLSARENFDRLYEKACNIIADIYTGDALAEADKKAKKYLEDMQDSVALTFDEKQKKASALRSQAKKFVNEDITESDVEKFLCCGIPFDNKGNLLKFSSSSLSNHFNNKRMSRQHIHSILSGKTEIDRFDLITLNFFIYAMNDNESNSKRRYFEFVESTNKILNECYMGELYIANPYECFILMCLLSDCPMGTFADVLEKSFENKIE